MDWIKFREAIKVDSDGVVMLENEKDVFILSCVPFNDDSGLILLPVKKEKNEY